MTFSGSLTCCSNVCLSHSRDLFRDVVEHHIRWMHTHHRKLLIAAAISTGIDDFPVPRSHSGPVDLRSRPLCPCTKAVGSDS